MLVCDGFQFDEAIPLVVFHQLHKFVCEVTVFKQADRSVQFRIRKREDSQADLTGSVFHAYAANAGLVAPFMQALQALEQFFFSVNGAACGVKVRFQGLPPEVKPLIIGRRIQRVRAAARCSQLSLS
jgi:hypothetical protein